MNKVDSFTQHCYVTEQLLDKIDGKREHPISPTYRGMLAASATFLVLSLLVLIILHSKSPEKAVDFSPLFYIQGGSVLTLVILAILNYRYENKKLSVNEVELHIKERGLSDKVEQFMEPYERGSYAFTDVSVDRLRSSSLAAFNKSAENSATKAKIALGGIVAYGILLIGFIVLMQKSSMPMNKVRFLYIYATLKLFAKPLAMIGCFARVWDQQPLWEEERAELMAEDARIRGANSIELSVTPDPGHPTH